MLIPQKRRIMLEIFAGPRLMLSISKLDGPKSEYLIYCSPLPRASELS